MQMNNIFPKQRGLFLVLFVIALASLMAIVLFGNMLSSVGKRADDAVRNQDSFSAINAAITQFVQLNLRLPCPADGMSATGVENTAPADTTTCLSPSGVVPWKTLGLPQAAAQDSWSRMISYRVSDGATGFTRSGGLNLTNCLDSDVSLVYPLSPPGALACNAITHENTRSDFFDTKGLSVNDRGTLKTQVAYALISHGASGYGAYAPASPPTRLTMPAPASKEFLNANAGGAYWILDPSAAGVAAEDGAHFDDILSYSTASDLVVGAKVGGRAWPLGMTLDRTDPVFPVSSITERTPFSSGKIAFTGGPIMMSAYKTSGATRYIASKLSLTTPPVAYTIGAIILTGGNGDVTNGEGLGFDFRVKRRVLKVVLASFNSPNQAQFTFYNGATQVLQLTKTACKSGGVSDNFVIDVGNDFTKAEIQALNLSGFSVASIAACQYDDASHSLCILPGQDHAYDCP